MAKRKMERPYGSGTYTLAGFRSFIMSGLRSKSSRWAPKTTAMKAARDGKMTNPKTGRDNIAVKCSVCSERLLEKDAELDHVEPVVPLDSFGYHCGDKFVGYNWNVIIERLFCEAEGYRVLCKVCHKLISVEQNKERRRYKNELNK